MHAVTHACTLYGVYIQYKAMHAVWRMKYELRYFQHAAGGQIDPRVKGKPSLIENLQP